MSSTPESRKPQIFLSYVQEDAEKVEKLYQKLSEAGFKPWMAKKDILPGEKKRSSIEKAIRNSDFFLVCLSANSVNQRGSIQREIKRALDVWEEQLDDDIYLIPVKVAACEIPERLHDFQWVDPFEDDGWTQLVKAIQVGLERRGEEVTALPEEKLEDTHQVAFDKKQSVQQPTVFISYSHKDEKEKDALLSHLGVLRQAGLIELWSDDDIKAGANREQVINQAIDRAKVAVLLISANFLSSDVLKTEIPRLLKRRQGGGLTVFPVIAKHCVWKKVDWLAEMEVRPKRGIPVWREEGIYADKELAAIAEEVAGIVEEATTNKEHNTSGSLDTRILQVLYNYWRQQPGDPKISLKELISQIPKVQQAEVIQCLYGLHEKGWLDYNLTGKAESGLVWLTQQGIKVAKTL